MSSEISSEYEESEYETESHASDESGTETDNESDVYESNYPVPTDIDYVNEAKTIIYSHADITTRNALALNQNVQEQLKELKRKLETLLHACREKYKANELLMDRVINQSTTKNNHRSTSFFFCGKPYFKKLDLFSAPLNADYLYRKNQLNEYFPIDHLDSLRLWSAKDKLFLVNGVKEQLLKCLSSEQRDIARKVKSGTRQAVRQRREILDDRSLDSKKLCELFELAKSLDFEIDWFTISAKNLDGRHSINECVGIWNSNLKPSLNRKPWTDEDDEKLLRIADEYNCQNWDAIGLEMNGRSGYECIIHYQGIVNDQNILKNCRWTTQEDRLLLDTIEMCRIGTYIPWTKVADKLPLRSKMQVYHRYMFTLKPDIKKEKFTVEEDCIITAAVKEYGSNFYKMSTKLLPGRTLVQIRHRYSNVLKHVDNFKEWTVEDDIKLMELTKELGITDWVQISKQLIHHTRLSCRSRYMTITKFLEKHPGCEIKDVPRRARKLSTKVKEDNWMQEIIKYKKKQHEPTTPCQFGPNTMAGMDFHEFFKFSYNFELKQLCAADEEASDKCRVISYMLHSLVYPRDHKLLYGPIDCRIDMSSMTNNGEDGNDYMIPPNWNTVLMLRGLAILYPNIDREPERCAVDTAALQLFKKRFLTLLYSSAVASHLKFPKVRESTSTVTTNLTGLSTFITHESKRKKT